MTENKRCWQLDGLPQPTPCFTKAGSIPCEGPGCLVDEAITNLQSQHIRITLDRVTLFCHSRCRISSLSEDNEEYRQRIAGHTVSYVSEPDCPELR